MTNLPAWPSPPEKLVLSTGEVHVWRIALDAPAGQVTRLEQVLSVDERERAARFLFERGRRSFCMARGCLRMILGGYLQVEPDKLRFSYTDQGKPYLAGPWGEAGLMFNLSHSHGLALVAAAYDRRVGVDIEHIRQDFAGEPIARRFFSTGEVSTLLALPAEFRKEGFFTCWTRKEAYIKARGEGLSFPLDQFDVTLTPGEPARLLATRPDPDEASRWGLQALDPGPGYQAAVAAEGQDWQVRLLQFGLAG